MASAPVLQAEEVSVPLGLSLPPDTTFEQWKSVGRKLSRASQALNWQKGDWWVFGEHRYGERAAAAAEGIFENTFGTLRVYGTVARAFEPLRRLNDVSFSHHQEVASLPKEAADRLLDQALRTGLTTRDLRRQVQAIKVPVRLVATRNEPQRPDLSEALQMVVEFAEAVEQFRALTDREQAALKEAAAYLDSTGYWSERDRKVLEEYAERRDWLRDAQQRFPNRTVPALQCMMQKVRAELGLTQPRHVESATGSGDYLLAALEATGLRP